MDALVGLGWMLGGYLVGSIPFGYLIARWRGVNILERGSGNIGATNVRRVLGPAAGNLCFALDVLKGMAPTLAAGLALGTLGDPTAPAAAAWLWLLTPLAAVAGHVCSPWLGFKGGKGVATGLGAMLGVFWLLTAAVAGALLVWLVALRLWRYVGLASVLAAASMPPLVLALALTLGPGLTPAIAPHATIATLLAALVVLRHRGNLARIARGDEPRVGTPKRAR